MPTYSNMCPDAFSRIKEIVQFQPKYSKTQDNIHSSFGWASQFITKTSFLLAASRQASQKEKVLGVSNEFYKDGFPSKLNPPPPQPWHKSNLQLLRATNTFKVPILMRRFH